MPFTKTQHLMWIANSVLWWECSVYAYIWRLRKMAFLLNKKLLLKSQKVGYNTNKISTLTMHCKTWYDTEECFFMHQSKLLQNCNNNNRLRNSPTTYLYTMYSLQGLNKYSSSKLNNSTEIVAIYWSQTGNANIQTILWCELQPDNECVWLQSLNATFRSIFTLNLHQTYPLR